VHFGQFPKEQTSNHIRSSKVTVKSDHCIGIYVTYIKNVMKTSKWPTLQVTDCTFNLRYIETYLLNQRLSC
jgi:hypothetical protein